jgi:hypothetical protein
MDIYTLATFLLVWVFLGGLGWSMAFYAHVVLFGTRLKVVNVLLIPVALVFAPISFLFGAVGCVIVLGDTKFLQKEITWFNRK